MSEPADLPPYRRRAVFYPVSKYQADLPTSGGQDGTLSTSITTISLLNLSFFPQRKPEANGAEILAGSLRERIVPSRPTVQRSVANEEALQRVTPVVNPATRSQGHRVHEAGEMEPVIRRA